MLAKVCLNASVRLHATKTNMICKGFSQKTRPPPTTGRTGGGGGSVSLLLGQQHNHNAMLLRGVLQNGHVSLAPRLLTTKVPTDSEIKSKQSGTPDSSNAVNANAVGNGVRERILEKMTTGHVGQLVSAFEEFLGISDVKRAQTKLVQLEYKFTEARTKVDKMADEVEQVQGKLRTIRAKLDRTSRDDPQFLDLATEEHHLIQSEMRLQDMHNKLVASERIVFQEMGATLRDNYEKQRVQEERSKYWSLTIGLATGIIAFIGSSIVNHRRMHTVQNMVLDQINAISGDGGGGNDLGTALESLTAKHNASLEAHTKTFQELLDKQEGQFSQKLGAMRKTLGEGEMGGKLDSGLVGDILNETQAKLEWEVKMSALSTVVLIYGAFALTLPILYSIFK